MFKYSKATNSIKEDSARKKPEGFDSWDAKSEWFKNSDYTSLQQLDFQEYKSHLASLKEYPVNGIPEWEDGKIIELYKDCSIDERCYVENSVMGKIDCEYNADTDFCQCQIATPYQATPVTVDTDELWIKTADKVPNERQFILVYNSISVEPAVYYNAEFYRYPNEITGDRAALYYFDKEKVTHWMPFPQKPTP